MDSDSATGNNNIYTNSELVIADHSAVADFSDIPSAYLDSIKNKYNIFYGHTSHGSQIVNRDVDGAFREYRLRLQ